MFTLNGGWGIIIKNKSSSKSIQFKLFVTFFSMGLVSILILSVIFLSAVNQHYVTEKKKELYRQANMIAISLVTTGYFSEEEDNSYLLTIQASVSGRGLVIDPSGYILFDSNHLDEGKIYSSHEVTEAINGNSSYYFDANQNIGLVTVPITDLDYTSVLGAVVISDSFDDISESINYLLNIVLLVILGLMLFIFAISYYFSRSFEKPFRRLLQKIDEASEGGSFEDLGDIRGNKEIEMISKAFNRMFKRLSAIEENRQQFVANVSHELKTPLSSVKVLAESLLQQPEVPKEIYLDFLSDINQEIDRENKIINDLLTLVTIENEDVEIRIEEVDINNLIEQIMRRLKPLAKTKNIHMVFESYRAVMAEADETKLELAIMNLVENAIKYNHDGGQIKVTLDSDLDYFDVKVKDTGMGISDEHIELIFDRFYRVDKTRSRETGGTGLGLSIVQKTVHMHQGTVRCISQPGEWTEFVIRIPLKQYLHKLPEEGDSNVQKS